jgi:glycosyltransferase involved in cell wall biosynthesis
MYSGNMGMSQRLDQVLEAAELLRDREDIVLAFVGDGADRRNLLRLTSERGLANVRFFDYQPKAELADSLSAADVHLVILRPEIKRLLMPSKLYGVLASGTPSLVVADDDCELAMIVREHDLGEVVRPNDGAALAEAIRAAAAAPARNAKRGVNARRYAEANCTRRASVAGMGKLLAGVGATKR